MSVWDEVHAAMNAEIEREAHEAHYAEAVAWVKDEIEKRTCTSDDAAQRYAEGFVTGFMYGLRKSAALGVFPSDPTAEAFWRGNLRSALEWERMGDAG